MEYRRRGVLYEEASIKLLSQFWEIIGIDCSLCGFFEHFFVVLAKLFVGCFFDAVLKVNSSVPDLENFHPRKLDHTVAICSCQLLSGLFLELELEAVLASGKHKAGSQSLQIPLPGGRQSF